MFNILIVHINVVAPFLKVDYIRKNLSQKAIISNISVN